MKDTIGTLPPFYEARSTYMDAVRFFFGHQEEKATYLPHERVTPVTTFTKAHYIVPKYIHKTGPKNTEWREAHQAGLKKYWEKVRIQKESAPDL